MYYLPILMVVLANIIYHLCQKSITSNANPYVSLLVTYLIAILSTVVAVIALNGKIDIVQSVKDLNWASYALGMAIVLLELGYLLAYRAGWNISIAALTSYILVSVLLIPIGILLFKEQLSLEKIVGISFCIVGLLLINR